jgi:Leucine-rich repeat (LRR) protein
MHDLPRQKLTEIVAKYGRGLCDDPRRCEALLRDFCGQYRAEINALVCAIKERVAVDLMAADDALPHEVLLVRLAKRLCDHLALSQEAARWAVESWALALGVISAEELQRLSSPPPTPAEQEPGSEEQRPAPDAISGEELQPPGTARRSVSSPRRHASHAGTAIPSAPEPSPAPLPHTAAADPRRRSGRRLAVVGLIALVVCGSIGGGLWWGGFLGGRGAPPAPAVSGRAHEDQTTAPDSLAHIRPAVIGEIRELPALRFCVHCAIVPGTRQLLGFDFGGGKSRLRLWDLASDREVSSIPFPGSIFTQFVVSPDGQQVLMADSATLRLFRLGEARVLRCLVGHKGDIRALAFAPDGQHAVSGGLDSTVRYWNLATGNQEVAFEGHTEMVACVAITTDGRCIVSGSRDRSLRLWEVGTGRCKKCLEGHAGEVSCVAVTPDGRRALSGGSDGMLRLWDLSTGGELYHVKDPDVCCVAIKRDGLQAVSGGHDGVLRVWELATGRMIDSLPSPDRFAILSLTLTPDGRYAVTGAIKYSLDAFCPWVGSQPRLWRLPNGSPSMAQPGGQAPDRDLTEQERAVSEIRQLGGAIEYDADAPDRPVIGVDFTSCTTLADSGLAHLKALTQLRKLMISRTKVTGAGLEHLKGLTQFRELSLSEDKLTDAGLEYLKGLTQLRKLRLRAHQMTDAGLECLTGLTQLQDLDISCTKVTDAGLEHLTGLTQLRKLNLSATKVTDAGLGHLTGLTQLEQLDLAHTQVTDGELKHLTGLTQLQQLDLAHTQVTDGGLKHLTGLTQLQQLYLAHTQVTDGGLKHLTGLTQLRQLNLSATKVTDAGLGHLKGLTQLQNLGLYDTKVTDAGVERLQKAILSLMISR